MYLRKGRAAHLVRSAAVVALAAGWAAAAHAADKLTYGPPEAWVKPVASGTLDNTLSDAPVQAVLYSDQVHFAADGDSEYSEYGIHVQTPAGLQDLQPVAVWNPDTDTVTIHKVQIIRGDQVIDVLKTASFTILRRETNLERSMLDGALTAVIQPEGLQVGDTLIYAMTVRHLDPVLKGHSESVAGATGSQPVGHTLVRATWADGKTIRWAESDDLPAGRVTKSAAGGDFTLDLSHVARPDAPVDAPARFGALGQVEFSQFTGWDEVSGLLAPLYVKAATLAPDSPLKAEAAKIRAASADPKVRAAMALHLVEDQVRYLFLGMNLGGYTPADADTTWARRFGDCKGKTALLLALLHELDIKAEPALISTGRGDGLDRHLPMLEWFDHVMVRAEIGGKVYWLDGTRLEDRDLDSLVVPNFGFALPVRVAGGALEALKPAPLDQPSQEVIVSLDASAGLGVLAKAHFEIVFRGDEAIGMHQGLDALTGDVRDKALRDYWTKAYSWLTVHKVAASFDRATGIERLSADGAAAMNWAWDGATRTWRFDTGTQIGWGVDNRRAPGGLHGDAPYMIQYPVYYHERMDVTLPKGGQGFALDGDAVDKTMGGAVFRRTMAIRGGALHIDISKRSLVPEITAAENDAARPVLTAMFNKPVTLVAPEGYKSGTTDDAKLAGNTSRSPGDLVNEAAGLRQQGKDDQALGRYGQALQLDPTNARALLGRGQLFALRRADAAAMADLQQALKSDPTLWQAWDMIAAVAETAGKRDEAMDGYSKALAIYANDTLALAGRARMHALRGDKDKARADAQAGLDIDPGYVPAVRVLSDLAIGDGKPDDAKAVMRKAIEANPGNAELYRLLASADLNCAGLSADACRASQADAVAQYDKVIALSPAAETYALRAQARTADDRKAAFDDLDQAIKLSPDLAISYRVRARLFLADKAYDKAQADADRAVTLDPKAALGYLLRMNVYFAQGKTALGVADIDRLVADHPDNSEYLNDSCWYRATHDFELDKALAACDAALKLAPKASNFMDSHGFVELRLGHFDQAIADYDAALALAPTRADSLYGRGIAKLRKGMTREGQADLAAARKGYDKIDETWAGYGIKP